MNNLPTPFPEPLTDHLRALTNEVADAARRAAEKAYALHLAGELGDPETWEAEASDRAIQAAMKTTVEEMDEMEYSVFRDLGTVFDMNFSATIGEIEEARAWEDECRGLGDYE